jgi:hypothetical protein
MHPSITAPDSEERDRAHARVASLLFLALAACASFYVTSLLTEHRPLLLRAFADMGSSLPLATRVAISLPFAWLPATFGLIALGKERLLRDPFLRLKWNGAQLVVLFIVTRFYIWAIMAPIRSLVHQLSG